MKITGAIFDFDGTLFNSMHLWKGVKYKFFDKLGIVLTEEDRELFKNLYLMESIALAVKRFDIKMTEKELQDSFFDMMKELYLEDATPKNDILEFLDKLRSKGVKIAIATATGERALEAIVEKFGMTKYFDAVYSTYTVGASKREPRVYDVALEAIGTDKDSTWVFEDALYAATTAKANGYKVVGIYDPSEPEQEKLKELVDIYIHNYSELEIFDL